MKNYFLQPSGSDRAAYVDYLLQRLTDFRQAGKSYGQNHQGQFSIHITRKIVQSQLGWPLHDETHFVDTCSHIQSKIDDTILGRRNAARGTASYHSFADHGKPKPQRTKPAAEPVTPARPFAPSQNVRPRVLVVRAAVAPSNNVRRDVPSTAGVCATIAATLQTMGVNPNANEIAQLWHTAFETVEAQVKLGKPEKKTKRALIRFLAQHTDFLSRNEATLRWSFNRKFDHWQMNGRVASCLVDGRIEANTKRRVQLSAADRDKVIATALDKHGGGVAPAWRDCLDRGELSPEINQRYLLNPSRKSHIPEAVARDVMPEVRLLLPHFQRPRHAKLNGAYIERDWSKVGAGDWYSSDDFTLEVYFYMPAEAGGFVLSRGQWLPMIDERSKCILDFILVPEKHYTGINVRTLINRVCERYGLPRCGIHFENGIWRKSQLVGGAVPIQDVKMNFAERLGIRLTHAQPGNARSKIVENVGKLFQAMLRGEPGWVGQNEQVLKIERVQRAKLDVESGRKHPAEAGFLSLEQWVKRLMELCEAYNATPQHSKVIGGTMSPYEAWRLLQTRNAKGEVESLVKPPPECRYLLATHKRRVRIGRNGVKLPKSMGGGTYKSEATGQLQGREVNIYFDPEMPEMISIVSDDRRQVFTVTLSPSCPAKDATPDEIADSQSAVSAHAQYARQRISQLRAEYMPPTRANIVDPRTSAVGREMLAQKEQVVTQQQTRKRQQARVSASARQAGLIPAAVADSGALERLNQTKQALTNDSD